MLVTKKTRRSTGRRATAALTSVALALFGLFATPPVATAQEAHVTKLVNGISAFADFSKALKTVGKFGEALPVVGVSPGAALGLDDLIAETVHKPLKDKETFADLAGTYPLGGGRPGTLTVTTSDVAGVKRVDATLHLTTVADKQPISVASASPEVTVSTSGAVDVTFTLDATLHFAYDAPRDWFYVVKDGASPKFTVGAKGAFDPVELPTAGFGILGVDLNKAASHITVEANMTVSADDPDGDGRLALSPPTVGTGTAELATAGAAAGLFHIGLAAPAGKVDVALAFTAQPLAGTAVGGISGTVNVLWPDIATGSPTVSVTGPDLAQLTRFTTLSPRDLVEGLSHLASSIEAIQRAQWGDAAKPIGNVNLPFMRGTLADAVKASGVLASFVEANVFKPEEDKAKAGLPKFTSVQEMFKLLNVGPITVTGVAFHDTTKKLEFTLTMKQDAPTDPAQLNAQSALTSGQGSNVSYEANKLKHLNKGKDWAVDFFKGRIVSAGTSQGVVKSNTVDELTLEEAWIGGTPAPGAAYKITSPDPMIGQVSFGDLFSGKGLRDANALTAKATVKPSYEAKATLVLDLRDPIKGDACKPLDPDAAAGGCPFADKNPDGTTTLVSSLPRTPDRFLLRTGGDLLKADAPVDTAIDVNGSVGYLKVHLSGELKLSKKDGSANMLTVGLKKVGDADGDLPLSQVFPKLVDDLSTPAKEPENLLTIAVGGKASATVSLDVPGITDFFGGPVSVGITMPDITDPATVQFTGLDALDKAKAFDFDPNNPRAMFGQIIKALQVLNSSLKVVDGDGAVKSALTTPLPIVGKSLSDLLGSAETGGGPTVSYSNETFNGTTLGVITDTSREGATAFTDDLEGRAVLVGTQPMIVALADTGNKRLLLTQPWATAPAKGTAYTFRSPLEDAVDKLTAAPPDYLQDLVTVLNDALPEGSGISFAYKVVGTTPSIVLNVDMKRKVATSQPVRFSFTDNLGTGRSLVAAEGEATANLALTGSTKIGFVLPLAAGAGPADAAGLSVLPDSTVDLTADGGITGVVKSSIGPLSIALGNPAGPERAVAKAHYNAHLGYGPGGTTPVPLSDFVKNVSLTLNGDNKPVTCAGDPAAGTDLALCAVMPVYVSANNVNWNKLSAPSDSFIVRLPRTGNLADAFAFTPDLPGGVKRFDMPSNLAEEIAKALLDFSQFGDGMEKYLAMIEAALRLAAFDGKLPLVGDDIQQGADEFGKLRAKIQEAMKQIPGGGRVANTTELTNWVNNHLKPAVGDTLTVGFKCEAVLQPATSPTASAQGTKGTTKYRYGVVATAQGQDAPPALIEVLDGNATISDSNFNRLTWVKSQYATGYKIIRLADFNNPASWKVVAELGKDATSHDDKVVTPAGANYVPATTNPKLADCPDGAALQDITGATFTFDVCANKIVPGDPCTKELPGLSRPLDIGIPGLSLREAADPGKRTGVTANLAYRLHVKVGVDKASGFFVATQDATLPELGVKLSFTLPEAMKAQLAFLEVDVKQHPGGVTDLFTGTFFVDLHKKGGPSCVKGCPGTNDDRIALADLADLDAVTDVSLAAKVGIDWDFKVSADSALPGISGWFHLDWEWKLGQKPGEGTPNIAFKKVTLNAGDFLGSVLKPIAEKIALFTKPIQPVIDQLYAPIPVLSDLSRAVGGGDVNLVTIAKSFSTIAGGPDLEFVDRILQTIQLVNKLAQSGGDVEIGDFTVNGEAAKTTVNSPDNAASLISGSTPVPGDLASRIDLAGSGEDVLGADKAGGKAGFSFPVLSDPTKLFGLIMGQDVDLIKFDSGPLRLAFSYSQSFGPVYAPPPVLVNISGSASVEARFRAGFDTYGIRKAVEAVQAGRDIPVTILDSIYLETVDDAGKPLPVVTFRGELAAGAAVSVVLIEVGIKGGVALTISLSWADPNNDGKFRFFEFSKLALQNPMCLFNMDGRLSLFLKVYITLGFSPFSVSFDFTLADITLLDFSVKPNCTPPPPNLADPSGTTLLLNVGSRTSERGDAAWKDRTAEEKWTVTQLVNKDGSFRGFAVSALGFREEHLDPNLTKVSGNATGDTGKRIFVFQGDADKSEAGQDKAAEAKPFDKEVELTGGSGDDSVKTSIGKATINGGPGKDQITTGDVHSAFGGKGSVTVNGDGEDDTITVGGAGNTVNGGGGIDRIAVGLGENTVNGGDGDDVIGVGADSPLAANNPGKSQYVAQKNIIIGGHGSDRISGGSGGDVIYTGQKLGVPADDTGVDEPGHPDKTVVEGKIVDATNTVNTGTGSDTVFGSQGFDFVTGGSLLSQVDDIRGGGNKDVLTGGFGKDKVYGGPGDDYVIAEPSDVGAETSTGVFGPERSVNHRTLPANVAPQSKLLVGGYGNDHVIGGDGGAEMFGDKHANPCAPPSNDPESKPPAEPEDSQDGRDLMTGGAGVETAAAGGKADQVDLRSNADLGCGQRDDDVIAGGNDNDKLYGGHGKDTAYGDSGSDSVYGNDDDDSLYGGTQNDFIEGNNGSDHAFGGGGSDVVVGGTRKAGEPDSGGDHLYGDAENDLLIGDNGSGDAVAGTGGPFDLDGANAAAGGPDFIFGGDADDRGFGGLAHDEVSGGANNDYLEGNNADDVIHGDGGEDRVVGGSAEVASTVDNHKVGRPDVGDKLFGDGGPDLITGDNAVLSLVDGTQASPITLGRQFAKAHKVELLDLGYAPTAGTSGGDVINGGGDQDVISGQGGEDAIAGDDADDYAEGGPARDTISGNGGQDDLVGGSSTEEAPGVGQPDVGDLIHGNAEQDLALGDNGSLVRFGPPSRLTQERGMTGRAIVLLDLGLTPHADSSGGDEVFGDDGTDVLLGQGGPDRLQGNAHDDYVEGNQGVDWIEGDSGNDDLVGGSSTPLSGSGATTSGQQDAADALYGGPGDDIGIGDNGVVLRPAAGEVPTRATQRLATAGGNPITGRIIQRYDLDNGGVLNAPAGDRFGDDRVSGGSGVDVLWGQDGGDFLSGGGQADYLEGNGGNDMLRGDRMLSEPSTETTSVPLTDPGWPGAASAVDELEGTDTTSGQDDMVGGSAAVGFRDGGDAFEGNGSDDVQLGDNGTLVRTMQGQAGAMSEKVYAERYATGQVPADATVSRTHDPELPGPSTRFCTTAQATCEPVGAFGNDTMFGNDGDDGMWGQDGDDTMTGSADDDDMYGELGNDTMFGNDGRDAMLGDRGGVVNEFLNADDVAADSFTISMNSVPQENYTGFRAGAYDRRVDLLHDVDGDVFIGGPSDPAMPHNGIAEGGDDRIRGGLGDDNIHAGFGDDLANGDSGGDEVFGGDGADVLWGGKGCDPVVNAATPDCLVNGVFNADSRGTNDRFIDHVFGGVGGTSQASLQGAVGSDVLDFNPRGAYPGNCAAGPWPQTLGSGAIDPCRWFEMTEKVNDDPNNLVTLADNQHHQGTDWQYGGWDRDVLQGDVAGNGPNPGDRLMDWSGAYNLYTHCNAAYGGYNDVRQFSPEMQNFLQKIAWGTGAGQTVSDAVTPGTSAFRELALVYPADLKVHGNGKAYPTTPGHFDSPVSCVD
ncbi:Ca2+-binding protein, RTX toxin-related [Actinokineospora alba]|uniref:Ca2+-binding protein, RTX toxin-related n=1 Tax=Actinokineospora alba TaxID=504798 RepID=A0A1H0TU09_9PSEU|nr:calcium-binding protein [Actinokineospora alba]TDP70723.1 Ca2+-binding RTX toxin-like protein [Actinokineospora alba]SDJ14585.1 Ca2+-binding protein, RTX toxin-related [Actinokineospora alba]SDP57602.1 Ca2+-binding protein, RTX toxin-related [Actinokineospora alba]